MREEVQRIIKLVQEGKLSPEDAAELIDAFARSEPSEATAGDAPPPPPPTGDGARAPKDPFRSFVESVERLGKDASDSVNWQEVARQVKEGTKRGIDALRSGFDDVSKGRVSFPFFGTQETREITLPLAVPDGKTLKIDNACGDIKVVGGFDVGSVAAKARFRGATPDEARSKADAYTLIIEESEHQVLIRQPDVSGLSVDLEIQLAGEASVEVRSEAGDVSLTDTRGGCRVTGRSGAIRLKGLNGPMEATSQSGNLHIEDCTTPMLTIENKAGDISLVRVTGDANVRTASGDVNVVGSSGKVMSIESVSGSVFVDLQEPVAGSVNIRTVNGGARLAIADGSDCRVALSTLRGQVSCGVSLEDETKAEQRISGRLGSGSGTIDVSAINGDVSLLLRETAAV